MREPDPEKIFPLSRGVSSRDWFPAAGARNTKTCEGRDVWQNVGFPKSFSQSGKFIRTSQVDVTSYQLFPKTMKRASEWYQFLTDKHTHSVPFHLLLLSSGTLPFHAVRIIARLSLLIRGEITLPNFVASLLIGCCSRPVIAPCFASCSSLCYEHLSTLDDSRPHDNPLMRIVTGARSGRCGRRMLLIIKKIEQSLLKSQPGPKRKLKNIYNLI